MTGRSLSAEENQRVIDAIRSALRAGETQVSLAKKLQVNQATLSSLLAQRHGAGYAFARKLAEVLSVPLDELLSGTVRTQTNNTWASLPGWSEAVAEAQKLFPRVSASAWSWLGMLSGPAIPGLAPGALAMIASAWDQVEHEESKTRLRPVRPARRS